jgi:DNA polymerase III subunit gamma/tau
MSSKGSASLNLARKWRSQQFDQIIGQDLSVRMLKNSLFRDKFFPVYLFAGQHGCGKTTTARVFAAAANCECLRDFQGDPKNFVVPCLTCDSCVAFRAGKHPDFIEIDAASNTGVDNIRAIVEGSSLLPVMGRKKIYLIDEAHMLSKAAFNAFLKVLEEPPEAVFFILATTDEHKIIDTVKSRCFQLFFNAVSSDALTQHLAHVCDQERIAYEHEGLNAIVKETGGSVRDALNLLEQLCFSVQRITYETVLQALGYIAEEALCDLLERVCTSDTPHDVIAYVEELQLSTYNASYVWRRLLALLHAAIWIKHGVQPKNGVHISDALCVRVKEFSLTSLLHMFDMMCVDEQVFLRTLHKDVFFSMLFVRMWHSVHESLPLNERISEPAVNHGQKKNKQQTVVSQEKKLNNDEKKGKSNERRAEGLAVNASDAHTSLWQNFVVSVDTLDEPLLASLVKQGSFVECVSGNITVIFPHRLRLFNDTLDQLKQKWHPLLTKCFGEMTTLCPQFVDQPNDGDRCEGNVSEKNAQSQVAAVSCIEKPSVQSHSVCARLVSSRATPSHARIQGKKIDVSDVDSWPISNALLHHFPGTIVEVSE